MQEDQIISWPVSRVSSRGNKLKDKPRKKRPVISLTEAKTSGNNMDSKKENRKNKLANGDASNFSIAFIAKRLSSILRLLKAFTNMLVLTGDLKWPDKSNPTKGLATKTNAAKNNNILILAMRDISLFN
jgi:hypothetical protein